MPWLPCFSIHGGHTAPNQVSRLISVLDMPIIGHHDPGLAYRAFSDSSRDDKFPILRSYDPHPCSGPLPVSTGIYAPGHPPPLSVHHESISYPQFELHTIQEFMPQLPKVKISKFQLPKPKAPESHWQRWLSGDLFRLFTNHK